MDSLSRLSVYQSGQVKGLIDVLLEDAINDAIMSGKPFTITAWVKGNKLVDEMALWKRRLTEKERVELRGNDSEHDGWRLLIYDYDLKRGRQYEIIRQ